MEGATYSTESLSGPLEDGSFVLDSVGDGDCRIQTTIAPQGGLILVTVRYGAACPAVLSRGTMTLRPSDIIGPLVLTIVLFGLVAILVIGNIPAGEAA